MKNIIILLLIVNIKLFGNDSIIDVHQNSSIFKIKREVFIKPLKKYQNNAINPLDYIKFAEIELLKSSSLKYDLTEPKTTSQFVCFYSSKLINRLIELAIKGDNSNRHIGILLKAENILQIGSNLEYLKTGLKDSTMIIAQQINNAMNAIQHYDHAAQLLSDSIECQTLNTNEKEKTFILIKKIVNGKVMIYDVIAEKFKNAPIPINLTNDERDTYKELLDQKRCECIKEELNTIDQCLNICNTIFEEKDIGYFENQKREIESKYFEECN